MLIVGQAVWVTLLEAKAPTAYFQCVISSTVCFFTMSSSELSFFQLLARNKWFGRTFPRCMRGNSVIIAMTNKQVNERKTKKKKLWTWTRIGFSWVNCLSEVVGTARVKAGLGRSSIWHLGSPDFSHRLRSSYLPCYYYRQHEFKKFKVLKYFTWV